jgi:hypothetical protein
MNETKTNLLCNCGEVTLSVIGRPIISAECLCSDCQKAAKYLEQLDGSPRILDQNSATSFILYRKDRVKFNTGEDLLKEYYLESVSSTRRVIARCCNTPVFLEFSGGHWLSIYGLLWPKENLPDLEIRTMTRSKPLGTVLSDDVPNPKTHTLSFYFKLFKAWVAMGLKTPKINFVVGKINGK